MVYEKIRELQRKHRLTNDRMGEIMGYKRGQSYSDMFKSGSAKVEYIENLCDYFHVPVTYFFEDKYVISDSPNLAREPEFEYSSCKPCIEKDNLITYLKQRIDFYESTINNYLSSIMKATGT